MRKESEAQRAAALYMILKEQTDIQHPMPMPILLNRLENYGIHAERRSIYHILSIFFLSSLLSLFKYKKNTIKIKPNTNRTPKNILRTL